MKVVALVNGTRIEIAGATQKVETLKADLSMYENKMRREMQNPPPMGGTFYAAPNTALAFCAVLYHWRFYNKRKVEILEEEGVDKIPYEEGVVY